MKFPKRHASGDLFFKKCLPWSGHIWTLNNFWVIFQSGWPHNQVRLTKYLSSLLLVLQQILPTILQMTGNHLLKSAHWWDWTLKHGFITECRIIYCVQIFKKYSFIRCQLCKMWIATCKNLQSSLTIWRCSSKANQTFPFTSILEAEMGMFDNHILWYSFLNIASSC